MAHYQSLARRDPKAPKFASLFVNDKHGTQLASAFDDQSISLSIGRNWAHRTYFHGGPDELAAAAKRCVNVDSARCSSSRFPIAAAPT